MKEVTRIATIQVTKIAKGDVEFTTKEECEKYLRKLFRVCDDVQVTVQDFVIDDVKEETEHDGTDEG